MKTNTSTTSSRKAQRESYAERCYPPGLAKEIMNRIAGGEALYKICKEPGMPDRATFYNWLKTKPEVLEQYNLALEMRAELFADELLEIADYSKEDTYIDGDGKTRTDTEVIGRSKLRVDTRKWIASRLLPKKYGDRTALEHTGANGGPVLVTMSPLDEKL